MQIHRFENREKARIEAQKALSLLFSAHKNTSILFLSSGGSALELMDGFPVINRKDLFTIGILDERYSEQEEVNNFLQLAKTQFFYEMLTGGATFINTSIQHQESLSDMAERFNSDLQKWRTRHSDGIIIATMGIGEDGHTAGIMSGMSKEEFRNLFESGEMWTVWYDANTNSGYGKRVTTTPIFLRIIDYAVIYVVGKNKERALSRVFAKEGDLSETPGRIIREMKNVSVFTDIT